MESELQEQMSPIVLLVSDCLCAELQKQKSLRSKGGGVCCDLQQQQRWHGDSDKPLSLAAPAAKNGLMCFEHQILNGSVNGRRE